MSVEDSESRRFEPKIGRSFSQADVGPTSKADVGPTSALDLLFSGLSTSQELFSIYVAHRKRILFFLAGIFEIHTFYGNFAVPLA